MKSLIVYSSQTGNTKKLADAAQQALPDGADMFPVKDAPDHSPYDFVLVGFWLIHGKPDPDSQAFLEKLKGHEKLFLFGTHAALPGSEHAKGGMAFARSLVEGATVVGTFSCNGQPSEKILAKARGKETPPVWLADAPSAVGHPDAQDLANLQAALKKSLG